ncbi:MAG: DUF87 domain-containing protein [Phycisphaerales bacterium]|nr:MAG: DUF87 domain-containing protein [Phycisphaerales bacterium]
MKKNVLPLEALTQHVAILGRTGSGKTYAAKGLVEELLGEGRRVCVLDPTGAWWGLKSNAAGDKPGFPVAIFGGDHADVAISEHSGGPIGELVASQNLPCIIDLSGTTLGERHRFVERFAESVFRSNKLPLHLVIDEADEFAPQSGPPGTERMLGAIDRIVRRGRIKGFRVMLISQRPAVLNKNVLTQASTMIAMRLPAPQDRKAVEDWIKGQADTDKGKEVLASLAKLKLGEGWVWSPDRGLLERTQFPKISTFDSGRTPDDGEQIAAPASLAEIDLEAVNSALLASTEEAKANDPKELRKRIRELEKELASRPKEAAEDAVRVKQVRDLMEQSAMLGGQLRAQKAETDRLLGELNRIFTVVDQAKSARPSTGAPPVEGLKLANTPAPAIQRPPVTPPAEHDNSDGECRLPDATKPQQKVLQAIAWWNAIGIDVPSRVQVSHVAGYTPSGGTWRNLLSECRSRGWIEYRSEGIVLAGDAVFCVTAGRVDGLGEMHSTIRDRLSGPQVKLFDVLLVNGAIERKEAANLAGYEASGGTWRNLCSELKSLGLAIYPSRDTIAPAAWLLTGSAA